MKFDRPIAFYPALARELGGIEEALFYQQLYYWSDKGAREDGFIYKTIEDIENETTITRRQQDRIREKLIEKDWIEIKKMHAPNGAPTLHYRCLVDISISTKRANGFVQKGQMDLHEKDKSISTKRTNVPYTKNTTETTTKNNATIIAPKADSFFQKRKKERTDDGVGMSLKEFILMCRGSQYRHVRLIAEHADTKSPTYTTRGQWREFGNRNLRAASKLAPYTDNQIEKAFDAMMKDVKSDDNQRGFISHWTMETLLKYLDEI